MFTGLVRERGKLIDDPSPSAHGGVMLRIGHSEELGRELAIGASLAVSGVCLTIIETSPGISCVELSPETLSRTTLGELKRDSGVNLEPPLRMGDTLGGHWVQGHVDATIRVVDRLDLGDHRELTFAVPAELSGYVVEKGSVALDGVSLTVANLITSPEGDHFTVALIPHTLNVTTLDFLHPDDRVNLEVDILAKYVRRALVVAGVAPE